MAAVAYVWLVAWPAAVVASYYAGVQLRRRRDLWLYAGGAVVVWGLGGLASYVSGGYRALVAGSPANAVLMGVAVFGLPLVAGLWVGARRQVLDAMREQAEQLRREQALRTEQARSQERARIAREMHDVVAHRVSPPAGSSLRSCSWTCACPASTASPPRRASWASRAHRR
ncbi:histidine kinase [Nonomuraea sp. LPB2021202275-12-8]|uniref:histidine kinase n=1 Tax=Nonomuraea sp. LPB2021202275-12-8 TaxID=3120159 RepID=UPI003FA53597